VGHEEKFALGHGRRFTVAQGHRRVQEWVFQKPMCDFLLVVNRDNSSKLLSFF